MKNKYYGLFFLVLLVFLPSLKASPTEARLKAEEPIKIGFFAPITTASLAVYAPWSMQGFELGLVYSTDNTNATDAGRPYEITYYDTQGSATDAPTLVRNAIEQDGIDILVGGTYSSVAGAIAPIAEEYKKLYFITPGADSALTGASFNKYTFRIARNSWHDAYAGVTYAMDTLNATNFAFLAADYSFGYSGVTAMKAVIAEKGGTVAAEEYAALTTTDFTPYITNILTADTSDDIDYLFIIWAGSFTALFADLATNEVANYMEVSTAVIDILSMNSIEGTLTPPATLVGGTGLCLYGYELPDNAVNDWMVQAHIDRNVKPNGALGLNYRVPELFTASGFATAQFLVEATNEITSLDTETMIRYLETGLNITTPKGPTYLRPEDHQGLAEMYIAEVWLDDRAASETNGILIAKLVERLPASKVAPPIETTYTPNPLTTTEPTDTSTSSEEEAPGFTITLVVIGVSAIATQALMKRKRRN